MNVIDDYARAVVAGTVPAVTIYALCDSRVTDPLQRVRYIGQTTVRLSRRLGGHVNTAQRGGHTHRDRWMRSVWDDGGVVTIESLAVVPIERWAHAEAEMIARYRSCGARLTNATDGGEGMPNPNAETRERLRRAFVGRPLRPEHRAKIGAAHRGTPCSVEQRASISATLTGRPLSDETRAKMSNARKGRKHSPEHSAKISAAKRAYYAAHPEARQRLSVEMTERRRLAREVPQ